MSYDIRIGSWNSNMTSNISAIFYDHMPPEDGKRGGLHNLHGLTGRQCSVRLAQAFDRISKTWSSDWTNEDIGDSKFRARYDAQNGWGSTCGALIWMAQIMAACNANPRARFHLSA